MRQRIITWIALLFMLIGVGVLDAQIRDTLRLTMSDGVRLDATRFRPTATPPTGGFPAIVFVHGLGGSKTSMETIARGFATNGYVTLAYSVRGQGDSEGLTTLFSWREQEDLDSVIAWLAAQPGVNDTLLGVNGGSQGGYHSWLAATRGMGVRAVAPENATPHFTDAMARNGCYLAAITSGGAYSTRTRTDTIAYPIMAALRLDDYDSVRTVLDQGRSFDSLEIYGSGVQVNVSGAWHDHVFWHNHVPFAITLSSPRHGCYLGTGGHGSENIGAENSYRGQRNRLFFDAALKGFTTGYDTLPTYVCAIGPDWTHRSFASWPPPEVTWRGLYPHADGSLSTTFPAYADTGWSLIHQKTAPAVTWVNAVNNDFANLAPAFRRDRRTWRTAPLTDTLVILGAPRADIWAEGPAGKFQVNLQLYDEAPDSSVSYLTFTGMGQRDNPESTAVHEMTGEFTIIGWAIPPGHRLRLDWCSIGQTLVDTSLWVVPYFGSYGKLHLYQDLLRPSSISIPVLGATTIAAPGIPEQRYNRDLRAFPNPARGSLLIEGVQSSKPVEIRRLDGSVVRRLLGADSWDGLGGDGTAVPAGIYIIENGGQSVRVVRLGR